MTQHPSPRELREHERQHAAEQPAAAAQADPAIAQYRLVYRAVRQATMPPVPADLAAALERAAQVQPRGHAPGGSWFAVPLLLALLVAMLVPHWDAIAGALVPALSSGPLRALWAAALAVAMFGLHERVRGLGRRS